MVSIQVDAEVKNELSRLADERGISVDAVVRTFTVEEDFDAGSDVEGQLETTVSRSSVRVGQTCYRVVELVLIPYPYVRNDVEYAVGVVGREEVHYIEHEVVVTTDEVVVVAKRRVELAVGVRFTTDDLQTGSIVRVVPLTEREGCRPRETVGELGRVVSFEEHGAYTTGERDEVVSSGLVSESYTVSGSLDRCGLRGLSLCGQGRDPC